MCLTTEAMFLFVTLISPDIVKPDAARILIEAEVGPVEWVHYEGLWCTDGPPSAVPVVDGLGL